MNEASEGLVNKKFLYFQRSKRQVYHGGFGGDFIEAVIRGIYLLQSYLLLHRPGNFLLGVGRITPVMKLRLSGL